MHLPLFILNKKLLVFFLQILSLNYSQKLIQKLHSEQEVHKIIFTFFLPQEIYKLTACTIKFDRTYTFLQPLNQLFQNGDVPPRVAHGKKDERGHRKDAMPHTCTGEMLARQVHLPRHCLVTGKGGIAERSRFTAVPKL